MMTKKNVFSPLLISALVISIFGAIMIFSASNPAAVKYEVDPFTFGTRQITYLILAMFTYLIIERTPLTLIYKLSTLILLVCFVLLVVVLIPAIGLKVNGARSWLGLHLIRFQPAELTKLALIIYAAGLLHQAMPLSGNMQPSWPLLVITVLLAFLLLLQPDFGGALIIFGIVVGMLFITGLPWIWFGGISAATVVAMTLLASMSPYQWARLSISLDPWSDPTGNGYQMVNAMIAIASGGWFGSGLGNSVQKYSYLPEAHTDFLLAITIEEFGIVSLIAVMLLYAVLFAQILWYARSAWQANNLFGYLLCWGTFWMIAVQAGIAIGVNLAILPTTGIPLPLFSFGGSSLVTTYAALGLVAATKKMTAKRQMQQPGYRYGTTIDSMVKR